MSSPRRTRPEPDGPDGRLTHEQWDQLVDEWNALHPDERRAEQLRCPSRAGGAHDEVRLPIANVRLCVLCFRYYLAETDS